MKYLLRGTLNKRLSGVVLSRGKGLRNFQRRSCQRAEPDVMSKTRIRTHKFQDAKMCPRVLAYDANALYPNTMEVVAQ